MGQREGQGIKHLLIFRPKPSLIHAKWNLAGFWSGSSISISFVWPLACIQKNKNASLLHMWSMAPAINFP